MCGKEIQKKKSKASAEHVSMKLALLCKNHLDLPPICYESFFWQTSLAVCPDKQNKTPQSFALRKAGSHVGGKQ